MARLDALPSIDIIRGFKGILDFYLWKGLPCVRAWPAWRPARQTDASLAAALLFGAVIQAFRLTHYRVTDQLKIEATGIPRTPRDIYVSGVYGNLHEASMSDFLTLLTQCRDFLSDLTALLDALHSIGADRIDVDVHRSILPTGASTLAEQQTHTTALQRLDDLQDALESKALDRLLVRGMDQLFSIRDIWNERVNAVISGAGGWVQSPVIGPGVIHVLTAATAQDLTSACTAIIMTAVHAGIDPSFHARVQAFPAGQREPWSGQVPLMAGDRIRVHFPGALAGDTCIVDLFGFSMTLET